jgi:predicted membrane channel-forming protein YqfA (hemolysin III family)
MFGGGDEPMIRWVFIMLSLVGGVALIAWVIADCIVMPKPTRLKALVKVAFGAACLTLVWRIEARTGFDVGATFFLGVVACLIGCAEMAAALMKGRDTSEPGVGR